MTGTKEELEQLFGGTVEISVSTVDVTWPNGHFSFTLMGDNTIYYHELKSNSPGALTEVALKMLPWSRERGLHDATIYNDGPEAAPWLTSIGFEPDAGRPGLWRANLEIGGRFDQWVAWKQGGHPEPDWHKAL